MKLTIIDPIDDPRLLEYIQIKHDYKHCAVYRFYSLIMYGEPIERLAPQQELIPYLVADVNGDENTREFDMRYANQLLTNPDSFVDLMVMMNALQYFDEVFLVSNYKHPNVSPILDSLVKFIQERYSISPFIVNAMEDIDELSKCDFASEEGYKTLMNDIDRFRILWTPQKAIESDVIE